jgi:hypothetical protein
MTGRNLCNRTEHAAKVGERMLVRLEKRLLRCVQIGAVESRTAGHRPHRENLHLGPLVAKIDPGFIPVDLGFLCLTVALRHERLPP